MKQRTPVFKVRKSRRRRKASQLKQKRFSRSSLILTAGLMLGGSHAVAGVGTHTHADSKKHDQKRFEHHHKHGQFGGMGPRTNLQHEVIDVDMQVGLKKAVADLNLSGAVEKKQLSVALVDITDPMSPRLAMLNGDEMRYAASLPKIAILFGALQKIHDGQMEMDQQTLQQMNDMIRVSSNRAATAVLNKVGRKYLSDLLQSKKYKFYDPELNGGLWVGKPYASGAAYQRDPLHGISHGATAFQVARFYYMIATDQLVSPEHSRLMKHILGNPGIHHKFVKGLEKTHPEARIFRKSGSWRHFHSDSAIIERGGRRYIAVALAEHPEGGKWLEKLIVAMDDVVFEPPPEVRTAKLESGDTVRW